MTGYVHQLKGCTPTPLASYLKALGILRCLAQQGADAAIRGWWSEDNLFIYSSLTKQQIELFFLERYQPTPIFNPWGARSGFYSDSAETTARIAISAIEQTAMDRLASFRSVIKVIRSIIAKNGNDKPRTTTAKVSLISQLRQQLRGGAIEWLDAVTPDLGGQLGYPSLFGSGGTEGSGGYPAAFFAAVIACVVRRMWDESVPAALWNDNQLCPDAWDGSFYVPTPEGDSKLVREIVSQPFRQFLPEGSRSPWDLLLAFEGALVIQSGLGRRTLALNSRYLASPFFFSAVGAGAPSSVELDEFTISNGRTYEGRGEQWMPVWASPTSFPEVRKMFRDGRCQCGRLPATNSISAHRAVAGLGTSRGISEFVRYGYLQRNNLSGHFAVPLGRRKVANNLDSWLIDDLSSWLLAIRDESRSKSASIGLVQSFKRLNEAIVNSTTCHPDSAHGRAKSWQAVLRAAVSVESFRQHGASFRGYGLPCLSPHWARVTDDSTPEFRLAISLAKAAEVDEDSDALGDLNTLRRSVNCEQGDSPHHVNQPAAKYRPLPTFLSSLDFISNVERYLAVARKRGQARLHIGSALGFSCEWSDIHAFLTGQVDFRKLLELYLAFSAIDSTQPLINWSPSVPALGVLPCSTWLMLRLCSHMSSPNTLKSVPFELEISRRLLNGDLMPSMDFANGRMRAAGRRPWLSHLAIDHSTARRWAAAFIFPLDRQRSLHAATTLGIDIV